ncbi:MAG: type II secretion system protein, partial [Gammaproteobacteria bacterium]
MRTKQAGYNMLELVATIAIVGVLAAVAAPKFMNTNTTARASTVTSAAGALQTINQQVFAAAAAKHITADAGTAGCTPTGTNNETAPSAGAYVDLGGSGKHIYICTSYGFATSAADLERAIDLGDMALETV